MVSNHFGAKVVTQCRGALPTFPRLNVFNYLSLISQSFGVCSGLLSPLLWWRWLRRMLKDGDQARRGGEARRLPEASAGDAWVEGEMSPRLAGVLEREQRSPQHASRVLHFAFCSLSSSGVGASLCPRGCKGTLWGH